MYSFGINLWEIYTRQIPYGTMQPMQVAVAVMSKGLRPKLPADMPRKYKKLTTACWAHDPQNRPSFAQILVALREIMRSLAVSPEPTFLGDAAAPASPPATIL